MITATCTYEQLKNVQKTYGAKFSTLAFTCDSLFVAYGLVDGVLASFQYKNEKGKPETWDADFPGTLITESII